MISNTHKQAIQFVAAGIAMCAMYASCHNSSSSSSSASDAFPVGMAVASPTADNAEAGVQVSPLTIGELELPIGGFDPDASGPEKAEALESIAEPTSASSCLISLPPFQNATNPACYGPALDYQNHPNGGGGNGQLPTGDLGIWTASENTAACTSAKINALIHDAANYSDYVMHLAAAIICSLDTAGTALPDTDGETIDMTSALNAAIQVNNPSVTVSSASLENLADVTVNSATHDAYKFTIVAVDTTGLTVNISTQMKHVPLNAANTLYVGRLRTWVTGIPNAGSGKAVSVTYEKTATKFRIKLLKADYNSASTESQIFDANDELKIDGPWTGNIDLSYQEVDTDTFLGSFSYAWQAGTGDSHARIFNGYSSLGAFCGFFGFGLRFDNTGATASDNVIDGMICNWAGPGNDHSMSASAGLAQKQCGDIDVSGEFQIDAAKNKITFAPTNSCNGSGSLQVKVSTAGSYTNYASVVNDLVTLASDTDFAAYTAPTAPTTF